MGTHASTTALTTPRSAAIRDYRYFEYTTPPKKTLITEVDEDDFQLKRLVISIKKKNASSSSKQTSPGLVGRFIQRFLGKPQKPAQITSSVSRTPRNSNDASSSSINGVRQVAPTSSTKSGASRAIPTSVSSAPLQKDDHEIIFLTAPNSWYGKFISWIFGSYQDIADELRKELGKDIITKELHTEICKEGITVKKLKELYTRKGSDDTATPSAPSGKTDNNSDTASIASYRSTNTSPMTSAESLSSPVTSSASLSSDSSHVTPLARSRSSSISSIISARDDASDAAGLSSASIPTGSTESITYSPAKAFMEGSETIPSDAPEANIVANHGHQKNPTGAALMHLNKFPPVANKTNPVVNSPIAENKNNSQVLEQEALFRELKKVITTFNPSTEVKLDSLEDLNKFYQERMQALKRSTKNPEKRADATNEYLFSADILKTISEKMAEKSYQLVVNQESGKFEFIQCTPRK